MEINITDVMQIINTVGFPIFVALFMMFINYKNSKEHKEEMKVMSDAVDNNTLAMTQIKMQMETVISHLLGEKHG